MCSFIPLEVIYPGNAPEYLKYNPALPDVTSTAIQFTAGVSGVNSNPNISAQMRDSINRQLAWIGLESTTAYSKKEPGQKALIQATGFMADDTAVKAGSFYSNSKGDTITIPYDANTLHMKKGCK